MPYVVNTEQKTWNHCKNHGHHESFHVHRIAYLCALRSSCRLWNKRKRVKRFEHIIVALPLSSFFEVVFYFVQCISQKLHMNQLFSIKSIPSRSIFCTSC